MIYFQLIYEYIKIGLFSFGGGYATIPFLYHLAENYDWFTTKQLSDMIAVASITPGPVGVNVATFSGFTTGGIFGALIATGALILPSFVIVAAVAKLLAKFRENKYVQGAIYALKPAGCGLLAAVAIGLFRENVSQLWAYILFGTLFLMSIKVKKDPLIYLGLSGAIGLVLGILKIL